jgi:hypothetical protein
MIELPPPDKLMQLADKYAKDSMGAVMFPCATNDAVADTHRAALESALRDYGEACARAALEAAAEIVKDGGAAGPTGEFGDWLMPIDAIRALIAPLSPSSSQTRS